MSDAEVAQLESQLLAAMPSQGLVGNGSLRRKLGWDEDRYWYIRNRMLLRGILLTGRGKGGSVQRVVAIDPIVQPPQTEVAVRVPESDLYEPIVSTLRSHWAPDHRIQDYVIHVTAHQGRRDTGGKWTRPDITLASSNTYTYVPGRPVELTTFEVKTHDGLDVTAVYEALAHRRAAHYSYVLAHVPSPERQNLESVLNRLTGDAQMHGIGFVILSDPRNYETWDFEADPLRSLPNPAELDNFIRTQTGDPFKEQILKWCRTL